MDLPTIQTGWDQAATQDAFFNILTLPGYQNGGWDPDQFFAHGQAEIDAALDRLDNLGISHGTQRALDFGCGVGRLTRALATHYRRADGVDISAQMIRLARHHNPTSRTRFHHNTKPNLRLFKTGTFDLVYSMIVLQHMPTPLAQGYVKDFIRILKPNGVAMFEIPDGPDTQHPDPWLSMYGTPRATVERWATNAGATVADVELIDEPSQWQCYRYTAIKERATP